MTIGTLQNRIDGPAKVSGKARYAADFRYDNLAHAVIVGATVPSGAVLSIETDEALSQPGVVAVFTHANIGKVHESLHQVSVPPLASRFIPMQGVDIIYEGQPVAIIVADTLEAAERGAELVRVTYEALAFQPEGSGLAVKPEPVSYASFNALDFATGDWDAAIASSTILTDHHYTQPSRHHNPMEPSAIVAAWQDDTLVVHDALQHPASVQTVLSATFGIPAERVRVVAPHTGGGFGVKAFVWPHEVLACVVAKAVDRPVKLVMRRSQMYDCLGYQPLIDHHVSLTADGAGKLNTISHSMTNVTAISDDYVEFGTEPAKHLYAAGAIKVSQRLWRSNVNLPTFMRSPVDGPGSFAMGCAIDELAIACRMDPLDFRIQNYAEVDPCDGRPWSSKKLREAYQIGADQFGWRSRPRGRTRDGNWSLGFGFAGCTQGQPRFPSNARVRLRADGAAVMEAAFADIGTGSATIFSQIVAEILSLPFDRISGNWGDTSLPYAAPTYGQTTTVSVGAAVRLAALDVRSKLIRFAQLSGPEEALRFENGCIHGPDVPSDGLKFADVMARAGLEEIVGDGVSKLPGDAFVDYGDASRSSRTFGVIFVEVGVDQDLGLLRLRRATGVYSAGRILNPKTARSQMIGGIVWGWGKAALEASHYDARNGRWLSKDLAGVALPVNADIPSDIHVEFVDEFDEFVGPLGAKGIGELGATGVAAAVANAVFDATGIRVRELPITPDKLL